MLFTKCILKNRSVCDGIRISVMNRHTKNDGITLDKRIREYDVHYQTLAPSSGLLGDYYKRGLGWKDFEIRYLEEIREKDKVYHVQCLAQLAFQYTVTILCVEKRPNECHRRLLAEECQRHQPLLHIEHR